MFENISDLQAYSNMFTGHKASKFGKKKLSKQSSKVLQMSSEDFDTNEYIGEDIILENGILGKLSFLYLFLIMLL